MKPALIGAVMASAVATFFLMPQSASAQVIHLAQDDHHGGAAGGTPAGAPMRQMPDHSMPSGHMTMPDQHSTTTSRVVTSAHHTVSHHYHHRHHTVSTTTHHVSTVHTTVHTTVHAVGGNHGNFDRSRYQRNVTAMQRFHVQAYVQPQGWYAHHWGYGEVLPRPFWAQTYWLTNYGNYELMAPPDGFVWVRDGTDALLIDTTSGEILQVEYNVFY